MAIHEHSNATQTKWDHGEFQVMLKREGVDQPLGFCDGSDADEEAIHQRASKEGAEVEIDKKTLKTGREIWTVRTVSTFR